MRLAHLIIAHAHPGQLQRLIKRLQHQQTDIYIQLDGKVNMRNFSFLSELQGVFFIKNRGQVTWGTYSMVQATLNAMEEIIGTGTLYSHINLLSGSCYPLKSAEYIYRFLQENRDKTFMDSRAIGTEWEEARDRVEKYNFGDYLFPGHYALQHMLDFFGIKKRTPPYLSLHGRSQWLTITPQCATYVINYLKENPVARRFFRMSFAPDEFIFQTILYSSLLQNKLIKDNLRYIDFPEGQYHPCTLTMADAVNLTASGKLFARKFNHDADPALLDYLDRVADFDTDINSHKHPHTMQIFGG